MLRLSPVLALCLPLAACAAAPPASAPPTARTQVFDRATATRDVARELDDFHDAAAHADEERYFAHFAPNGVFLGTDVTERWDVAAFRAYAHPHFAKGHGWTYHPTRRAVDFDPSGTTAWFDEDLIGERVGPTRGTGVLTKGADGRWRIALYDLGFTVPNERFDAFRAAVSGTEPCSGGTARAP